MSKLALGMMALMGCGSPRSAFDFDLSGDISERVTSSANGTTGRIDNGGHLALVDPAWGLTISLPGLAPGTYTLGPSGRLAITDEATGDVLATTPNGPCTVTVDPHSGSNGSTVSGTFSCTGLASFDGKRHVDVTKGSFTTLIDDAANNPAPP